MPDWKRRHAIAGRPQERRWLRGLASTQGGHVWGRTAGLPAGLLRQRDRRRRSALSLRDLSSRRRRDRCAEALAEAEVAAQEIVQHSVSTFNADSLRWLDQPQSRNARSPDGQVICDEGSKCWWTSKTDPLTQ